MRKAGRVEAQCVVGAKPSAFIKPQSHLSFENKLSRVSGGEKTTTRTHSAARPSSTRGFVQIPKVVKASDFAGEWDGVTEDAQRQSDLTKLPDRSVGHGFGRVRNCTREWVNSDAGGERKKWTGQNRQLRGALRATRSLGLQADSFARHPEESTKGTGPALLAANAVSYDDTRAWTDLVTLLKVLLRRDRRGKQHIKRSSNELGHQCRKWLEAPLWQKAPNPEK